MLRKKLSIKKLAKKVKAITNANLEPSHNEYLLVDFDDEGSSPTATSNTSTPTGTFPVYVGEDRQRFVVPTGYLSHPLFKMLLDKVSNEFGFEQRDCLVVTCSIIAFHEVISAVESCNGQFHFGELVEEFL